MPSTPAYNRRRFFRLDTRLPLFFAAAETVIPSQIFTLRTDYFSPYMRQQVSDTINWLDHWLSQVQEHRATLEQIFSEMRQGLTFFGETLVHVTEGTHPKRLPNTFFQFQRWKQGFASLHLLEHNAPKTHTFISQIEEKFKYYLSCLEALVLNSDEHFLYTQKDFKVAFGLDETKERLNSPGFRTNPLAQSILSAIRLLDLYVQVFHDLNQDHAYRNSPELWPTTQMNVSGGGIAFHSRKGYERYQMLDIGLWLPRLQQVARFKGRILYITPDPDGKQPPRLAINFEFPDGHDQRALISELQRQELHALEKLTPLREKPWHKETD